MSSNIIYSPEVLSRFIIRDYSTPTEVSVVNISLVMQNGHLLQLNESHASEKLPRHITKNAAVTERVGVQESGCLPDKSVKLLTFI